MMKRPLIFLLALTFFAPLTSFGHGQSKAIYGRDLRQPVIQAPSRYQSLAKSVGIMFSPVFMTEKDGDLIDLDFESHTQNIGLCAGERFENLPTAAISCTGFLISPTLLVTAGHCMINVGSDQDTITPLCSDFHWYFGFEMDRQGKTKLKDIPKSEIYSCKRVVRVVHETHMAGMGVIGSYGHDYALIELDRPVTDRPFLTLAKPSTRLSSHISLIGHPDGLPKMAVPQGRVIVDENPLFFEAAIDSFAGNSGSPIFNSSFEVVGIMVRGPDDYTLDQRGRCQRPTVCSSTGQGCTSHVGITRAHINRLDELLQWIPLAQ